MAKKIRIGFDAGWDVYPNPYGDSSLYACDGRNDHFHENGVRYNNYHIMGRNIVSTYTRPTWYSGARHNWYYYSASGLNNGTVNYAGQGYAAQWYNGQNCIVSWNTNAFDQGFFARYDQYCKGFDTDENRNSNAGGIVLFEAGDANGNMFIVYIAADLEGGHTVAKTTPGFRNKKIFIATRKDGEYNSGSTSENIPDSEIVASSPDLDIAYNQWSDVKISINNSGEIFASYNGIEVEYDLKQEDWVTDGAFSSWDWLTALGQTRNNDYIDNLSINDGSGATDNGIPNRSKMYNLGDSMSYEADQSSLVNDNSFGAIGTILSDEDDDTYVTVSKGGSLVMKLNNLDFLPAEGHGFSEAKIVGISTKFIGLRTENSGQKINLKINNIYSGTEISEVKYLSLSGGNAIISDYVFPQNITDTSSAVFELKLEYEA
tara:strand:+ start:435 stop:1727 length:1293 start_codon:yes stop_codon:yes gene_type:complete